MKTIKHFLLTVAVLLCNISANAHDFEVDGIYYNITSEEDLTVAVTFKGENIYDFSDRYTGSVNIPKTVTHNSIIYNVTSIGESAFYNCSGLTSVIIPNSVTSIGNSAFSSCYGLKEVNISDIATWCNIEFWDENSNPLKYAHHLYLYTAYPEHAVDLGLPSGTLWADRNIGADSPEDYGDYFSWGETEPKSFYNWSTYKWCNGEYGTFTKYCTDSSLGTVDNKTTLDSTDDAAIVNWGDKWGMPTYEQLLELESKCTWTWITQDNVNGYKVKGPNGKSIFLPATGRRSENSLDYAGSSGFYWSSSLCEDYIGNSAWLLGFGPENRFFDYGRSTGYPIRAVNSVKASKEEVKDLIIPEGVTAIKD